MKSNLSLKSLKGNLLNKEELSKLNELESLTPEYESLLKTRKRLTQKLADVNNRITAIENNQKQVALLLKKNNHHLTPVISVGFDKRWATYNCIVKISGSTKSFYLGKEKSIKGKVQQFHKNNIMSRGINFLKSEIIEIVSTVIMQFIDPKSPKDPFKKTIKLNLENVLERYVASGEWDYWVSR
tara:strand:+ start:455 stop:1006 length:552 start_codon:yes stop_codon:yes gene_type:complete